MTVRSVGILLFEDVEVLDFAGPYEVLTVANHLAGGEVWRVETLAFGPGEVRCRHGLRVRPDRVTSADDHFDLLVIPGGRGTRRLIEDEAAIAWTRAVAPRAQLVLSVCTGSLLLARAGLLGGLTVTTHAEVLDSLARLAPDATIDATQRFDDNGRIITAAGISAGIDAALHVVSRLLGPAHARTTARHMEYLGADAILPT
jgi:transcriptional regulator GlxA family with amidase domain